MAGNVSLNTVTDGLVMYLDASNTKSLADVPSRNLMIQSQDFTSANWLKVRSSVTASATTAPDNTLTGTKLINDTSNNTHYVRSDGYSFNTGDTYTISFYSKSAELTWVSSQINENGVVFPTTYVNLSGGTLGSIGAGTTSSIQNVGSGWYRISTTRTVVYSGLSYFGLITAIPNNNISYSGDGVSGVYIWGVQLELGSVATTYIPTTTVAVSRIPTWVDITGKGNNGTLSSGLTYNYSNGGGLVFNGINNNFTFPTITFTNTPYTIEIVSNITGAISPLGFTTDRRSIFGNTTSAGEFSDVRTYLTNIVCDSTPTYFNFYFTTAGLIVQNTIFHWVFTLDSSKNVRMYFNGNPTTSVDTQLIGYTNLVTTFNRFGTWNNTRFFMGNVYTTRMYNRALSASEVLQNYNATKSRFGL